MGFLDDYPGLTSHQWNCSDSKFTAVGRFNGPGLPSFEVCVATSPARPKVTDMRDVWKDRRSGKAYPLLLVVVYESGGAAMASVCGPDGDTPEVDSDIPVQMIEGLCAEALKKDNKNAALRFLRDHDLKKDAELLGVNNVGLFATNELLRGVPHRDDWEAKCVEAEKLRGKENQDLLRTLGFSVKADLPGTSILVAAETDQAVAVFLDESSSFEVPQAMFQQQSPVNYGLAAADRLGLDWVVMVRGSTMRLYSADPNIGVGRRGRASTYLEVNVNVILSDTAGLVPLCFSPSALDPGGTVSEILNTSEDFVVALGERLRDRVYFDAVPGLATVLADKHGDSSAEGLREAYAQTMSVLFRLLFLAYGEDKRLLPYKKHDLYTKNSLTLIAQKLTEQREIGRASCRERV